MLGTPYSYRLRRVKRHVTLLSVHRFVHGLLLLQRSSLPLLLILLANDVELNPGPVISSEHLEHCSSVVNNRSNTIATERKTFRCLSWNTRSLFSLHRTSDGDMISNNSSLQDFVYSEQIDIVFLTETWLSDKHFDAEILRQDYNVFRVDRKCKTGGGVLIATKESSFTETKQVCFNQSDTKLEIVCVECATNNARILVVCCYRAPDSSSKWLLSFKKFLDYIMDTYDKIIMTGDFNFPRISWSESMVIPTGESERFFYNTLSDHYLSQLIFAPTRETNVLDLIMTNIPDNVNNIEVIDPTNFNLFSDHKCILFEFQSTATPSHKLKRSVYDYNRADFEKMNRTFESIEFEFSDPTSMSDINENWNLWRDTFLAVADECIPTKIVKGRYNPPWLTGEIKSLIKKKETLRRKIRRGTNSAALVQKYKNLRRTSKRLIKESREKFFGSLSEALPSNPKLFWSFFKTTTKSSRILQQVSVATGNEDSPRLDSTSQKQAAEMFNDYFHSVFLTEDPNQFPSSWFSERKVLHRTVILY
ncbi:Hypothetical predicted protein, partial [Paramuricea clavata]